MPRIEIESIERVDDLAERSTERFDRNAFAERAIELVRPPNTTVAIRVGARRVQVAAGRQWGKEQDARWAIVSIPPEASRRAIALGVLALHDGKTRGWALDVLVAAGDSPGLASNERERGTSLDTPAAPEGA